MSRASQGHRPAHRTANPRQAKAGLVPGTPMFIGRPRDARVQIDRIVYDAEWLEEQRDARVADCAAAPGSSRVTWINVSGVHDIPLLTQLGEAFGVDPMTLEDIANTNHRPKCEAFPNYLFIVLKMLWYEQEGGRVASEHVSLILGANFVVSFLEDEGDLFDGVRHRIRKRLGRIRSMKADYLAYCLMDVIVDHYFAVVQSIGDEVEVVDDSLMLDPRHDFIRIIHHFKREVMTLRRAVWPMREVASLLTRRETPLLQEETLVFWRDLYDHTVQVIEMVEAAREMLASLHDSYLSSLSNRMNEVMKVLTIISTIFIPLSFIAGVYGMNFENMPELRWREGYRMVLLLMVLVGVGLVMFFRKRRWL
jgi:magnesium transporter